MLQVCEICGDAGFADCLYICKQCKGAEHLYCMPMQPDSDEEACWTCEICMLKQETTQGTVVSSLHSEIEQSQEKFSECQRECQDSHPTIKKQASEGSDGTDSPNEKQEPDNFDCTQSLPASKKTATESSNETDSLPKHKEKMLRNYSDIEILFNNKKQNIGNCNGIDSSNNSKQALNSSNCTDFLQSTKKQVLKNSDGPDFPDFLPTRKKQVVENSGGSYSCPSYKKQELEISKGTSSLPVIKKQEFQSSKCIDSLQGSKKQSPKCFSRTDSLLINKKEVVKSSFGTDSPPASEKQMRGSSKDTSSLPTSKKQPLGSANCTDSLSVGKKRVLENSKCTDSLPASKKESLRSSSGADSLPGRKKQTTESFNDTDWSKESSENRPNLRQSPVLKAQVIPALVSSGSKSAIVDKSFNSSCPNTLDSAKISLRSSKEIDCKSEQSSLNRKLSKSKVAVECGMELKKYMPADSIRVSESNKDSSRSANKVLDKHNDSKMPKSLSPMEVDMEFSSGLSKGDSSGYDAISTGVTNNHKEIDQSLIGKSTVEDTMTVNERDYEINNRGIEKNSISQDTDNRKLDVNVDSWNNHSLRSLNEYDKEKMGHSMINFSEKNVSSSSELENQSLNTCGRDFIAQNMLPCTNCSSVTSPQQQLQLAVPQSLILWNGAFNVHIAIGHVIYDGMKAHPSTTASLKVYEMSKQFGSQLYLEQVHRAKAWPKRFEQSPPTDDNVGLYFFPEDGKSERAFATLVEYINKHDLAMRMHMDGADLLIFSSIQLPKYVQRIFGKFYLWGVFRRAEKSTTGHKLHEASMQHDHVRADMSDLVAPSRSNNSDSTICVAGIENMCKNGVKEEMDFEIEGGKDVAVSERPLSRMDFQPAGLPPVCISPPSLPLDSEFIHFQTSRVRGDDANTSGCALYGQDQSLPRIRSKVNSENCSEEASRRYSGKHIDQSHKQYHCSGIEKIDCQSEFNLSDQHILHGHYPVRSQESMQARSNEHKSHGESNIGESTPRIGTSNRSRILEEKDENELLTLHPQPTNIKHGFVSTPCPMDCNSRPSSSNHVHEKQGFMHSQIQSNANAGAEKQNDPRDPHHVFSSRIRLEGHHNSHQSSLSSGDSDCSNGNKGGSHSHPTYHRKLCKHEDINRFRSESFRVHIGTQTKSCNGDDRSKEDTKLVVERDRERSHRHWQTMNVRTHAQAENHRGCKERTHKHWQTEDGRRRKQTENRISPVDSSDSYSDKGDMLEEASVYKDFSSYSQEKTSKHRWSSNNHQNQVKNCVDKDKVYMVENFKSVKMDCSVTELGAASYQYQVVKDQQSFSPLHTATDETVENNTVSEISNAASSLESPGQIYCEEIVPRLLEADLPVKVNSRTEHTTPLSSDPLLSHGIWYAASSTSEVDEEPVEYLQLFPLEEENLGVTKNTVKDLEDINLDLRLGRGIVKTTLKMVDRQVCPNRSNLEGPDVNPCLDVSLPLEKRKETYT